MNFGDRLKQLRTQKNLTQPQLAQAIGIEQSYLSKLENDKSVPGADIFQSILRALQMDVASFLEGVDENIVHRGLRQVPEVANHLNSQSALRIHNVKKWLYGSSVAGILGLTLFFAGYQEVLLSNSLYPYASDGIVNAKERSEAFLTLREYRGDQFIEQVPGGSRVYTLMNKGVEVQSGNRALMFVGLLLTFTCLFGFIVEWRLRQLKRV